MLTNSRLRATAKSAEATAKSVEFNLASAGLTRLNHEEIRNHP